MALKAYRIVIEGILHVDDSFTLDVTKFTKGKYDWRIYPCLYKDDGDDYRYIPDDVATKLGIRMEDFIVGYDLTIEEVEG